MHGRGSDDVTRTVYTVVKKAQRHRDNGVHTYMWHVLMLSLTHMLQMMTGVTYRAGTSRTT